MLPINRWPTDERPREKLLQRGATALSDAELLSIFLRTGVKGQNALDLARDLLVEFKGLSRLMTAEQSQLCAKKGLGPAKYAQLQAVLELSRRYLADCLARGEQLNSPDDLRHYLASQLRGYRHEVFAVLFLDNQNRMIQFEPLFTGTINGSNVHPREVVKRSLYHNAAAVIFAHNHPSGLAEPSNEDVEITHFLRKALAMVDVTVLDHFIIGDGSPVSLLERGLL